MKICLTFRLPLSLVLLAKEATEERAEDFELRKEWRLKEIQDAVELRLSVGEGGGLRLSVSPINGANGRGSLPSAE